MSDYAGQTVDLEVGRYGLRTFTKRGQRLTSVIMRGYNWDNGVCESICIPDPFDRGVVMLSKGTTTPSSHDLMFHKSPYEWCGCGIYATHTLDHLRLQYPLDTKRIVAVIAAEGQTLIGDKGFRTERARVVAYWCTWRWRGVARRQFVDAQSFRNIDAMLEEYGLQ